MNEEPIEGGYIILARRIIESELWQKPAAYLKIWIYILHQVNFKNTKAFPRGTGLFNFRKEKIPGVTLNQVYEFLRWAKRLDSTKFTTQITTEKTTRGIVLKVNNYNKYQDIENYCHQHRLQQKKQQVTNTITGIKENNNIKSKDIYISSSSSSENFEDFYKNLSEEEEEFLKNYSKGEKIRYFRPWLRKIYENGDFKEVLLKAIAKDKKEKQKAQRYALQADVPPEEKEDEAAVTAAMKKAREQVIKGLQTTNKGEKNG